MHAVLDYIPEVPGCKIEVEPNTNTIQFIPRGEHENLSFEKTGEFLSEWLHTIDEDKILVKIPKHVPRENSMVKRVSRNTGESSDRRRI